jgi:hypothetical protein
MGKRQGHGHGEGGHKPHDLNRAEDRMSKEPTNHIGTGQKGHPDEATGPNDFHGGHDFLNDTPKLLFHFSIFIIPCSAFHAPLPFLVGCFPCGVVGFAACKDWLASGNAKKGQTQTAFGDDPSA